MMKQNVSIILILIIFVVTGCWDERLLKDHSLILAIGYDRAEDAKIQKTVTFPQENSGNSQQSPTPTSQDEVITVTGNTVKDTDNKLDQFLPQKFDRSKSRVVLLGKNLSEEGIFSTLDSIYRDLRGPLNASVMVVDGSAKEALNVKRNYSFLVSEFYKDLVHSAEESDIVKNSNVQSVCPTILSGGKDIVLPLISLNEDGSSADIKGLALFSGDKMTGKLNIKQSTMYLLLSNQIKNKIKFNFKVNDKQQNDPNKNYVDFIIRKSKRKLHIKTNHDDINVKLDYNVQIEIDEYASDHLNDAKKVKELSKKIEDKLNELAKETISELQKANSDSLGLGEKIKSKHNRTWKKVNWDKKYSEIQVKVKFDVEIIRHGILN